MKENSTSDGSSIRESALVAMVAENEKENINKSKGVKHFPRTFSPKFPTTHTLYLFGIYNVIKML